jgi:hypothetical protein
MKNKITVFKNIVPLRLCAIALAAVVGLVLGCESDIMDINIDPDNPDNGSLTDPVWPTEFMWKDTSGGSRWQLEGDVIVFKTESDVSTLIIGQSAALYLLKSINFDTYTVQADGEPEWTFKAEVLDADNAELTISKSQRNAADNNPMLKDGKYNKYPAPVSPGSDDNNDSGDALVPDSTGSDGNGDAPVPGSPGSDGSGDTPDAPKTKVITGRNISTEWAAIVAEVTAERKYVILDLSGCTAIGNIIYGASTPAGNDFNYISKKQYIKGIILPSTLTTIWDRAFYGCSGLTSVTIPSGVTSIGEYAFYGCSGLTSVTIPSGATSIENGAFQNCSGFASVDIPSGVTSIGEYAFSGCSGLTSVTIPSGVTSIGRNAFFMQATGKSRRASGVTSIGRNAFYGCSGLTSVTIPSGVTSIGQSAFSGCSGLTSITIPSGASIEYSAFSGCTGLTSITIPSGVTSIGQSAFAGCGLASITIPSGVTSIGESAFYGCSGLTSVDIPSSVTSIENGAFQNCSLASITIPSGVTSIGQSAFAGCGLASGVTFVPASIANFHIYAFNGDLQSAYSSGGAGTYISSYQYYNYVWTKQQ